MSKEKREKQPKKQEIVEEVKPELLNLTKALYKFKLNNPEKEIHFKDIEIIKLYAIKHIPNLLASQETWKEILKKF